MRVRLGLVSLVGSLLLSSLAGCSGPAPVAPLSIPAPVLSVGDQWQSLSVVSDGGLVTPTNVSTLVTSTAERVVLGNGTYDAVRLETHQPQVTSAGKWDRLLTSWQRKGDGAQMRINVTTRLEAGATSHTYYDELAYDVPCPQYPWPLIAGTVSTATCTTHDPGGAGASVTTFTYKVVGLESVKVPAGSFQAMRVNITVLNNGSPAGTQVRWFSPLVCGEVRSVVVQGTATTTTELQSFRCARATPVK